MWSKPLQLTIAYVLKLESIPSSLSRKFGHWLKLLPVKLLFLTPCLSLLTPHKISDQPGPLYEGRELTVVPSS